MKLYFHSETSICHSPDLVYENIMHHSIMEKDSHASTPSSGHISSLCVTCIDCNRALTVCRVQSSVCDVKHVCFTFWIIHDESQLIQLIIHTVAVPLDESPSAGRVPAKLRFYLRQVCGICTIHGSHRYISVSCFDTEVFDTCSGPSLCCCTYVL